MAVLDGFLVMARGMWGKGVSDADWQANKHFSWSILTPLLQAAPTAIGKELCQFAAGVCVKESDFSWINWFQREINKLSQCRCSRWESNLKPHQRDALLVLSPLGSEPICPSSASFRNDLACNFLPLHLRLLFGGPWQPWQWFRRWRYFGSYKMQ